MTKADLKLPHTTNHFFKYLKTHISLSLLMRSQKSSVPYLPTRPLALTVFPFEFSNSCIKKYLNKFLSSPIFPFKHWPFSLFLKNLQYNPCSEERIPLIIEQSPYYQTLRKILWETMCSKLKYCLSKSAHYNVSQTDWLS